MSLGLNTARAIVVDDNYAQVEGIMRALARLRIGSVYLSGQVEDLASDKLTGIRLAFVDMDLVGDGSMDEEEQAENVARFLSNVIDGENGLLAIFVWTRNMGTVEYFKSRFREYLPGVAPIFMESFEKPPEGMEEVPETADRIVESVTAALATHLGIKFLWQWEQLTHDAVSQTSASVVEVVRRDESLNPAYALDVSAGAIRVFSALALAARERPAKDGKQVAADAIAALTPILQDHLEMYQETLWDEIEDDWEVLHDAQEQLRAQQDDMQEKRRLLQHHQQAKAAVERHPGIDLINWSMDPRTGNPITSKQTKRKRLLRFFDAPSFDVQNTVDQVRLARLNRMIHVSRSVHGPHLVLPGNAYMFQDEYDPQLKFADALGVQPLELIHGISKAIEDHATPLVIEISPACDFAQGKVGLSRLIGGLHDLCGTCVSYSSTHHLPL